MWWWLAVLWCRVLSWYTPSYSSIQVTIQQYLTCTDWDTPHHWAISLIPGLCWRCSMLLLSWVGPGWCCDVVSIPTEYIIYTVVCLDLPSSSLSDILNEVFERVVVLHYQHTILLTKTVKTCLLLSPLTHLYFFQHHLSYLSSPISMLAVIS